MPTQKDEVIAARAPRTPTAASLHDAGTDKAHSAGVCVCVCVQWICTACPRHTQPAGHAPPSVSHLSLSLGQPCALRACKPHAPPHPLPYTQPPIATAPPNQAHPPIGQYHPNETKSTCLSVASLFNSRHVHQQPPRRRWAGWGGPDSPGGVHRVGKGLGAGHCHRDMQSLPRLPLH